MIECEEKDIYIEAITRLGDSYQSELEHLICRRQSIALKIPSHHVEYDIAAVKDHKNDLLIKKIKELELENYQLSERQRSILIKEEGLLEKIKEIEEENHKLTQNLYETIDDCEKHKNRAEDLLFDLNKKTEEIKNLYCYKEQSISNVNSFFCLI